MTKVLGFFYKEGVMIDKKVLKLAIMKAEEQFPDCAIDTILRIDSRQGELFDCKYCVYNDIVTCLPKVVTREIYLLERNVFIMIQ